MIVFHHLGFGDGIICNGLVNHLSENNDITLLSMPKNEECLKYLYKYNDNINIKIIEGKIKGRKYNQRMNYAYKLGFDYIRDKKYLIIGYGSYIGHEDYIKIKEDFISRYSSFDVGFYKSVNIPFNYKWEKFKLFRDEEKEYELFCKYDIKENEYVFIHDDKQRNLVIDKDGIRPVIGYSDNMLLYAYMLEHAKEIHCIDSSFLNFSDVINTKGKLFFHKSVRGATDFNTPVLRKDWVIL